ncbi:MAG TPA: hypothetical protein VJR92_13310 [Gemmatimonadaceae bacterium]|nr:hypothetical protein [Gemmatimonadaceae bacterium]
MKRIFAIVTASALASSLCAAQRGAPMQDAFANVRCGENVVHALVGQAAGRARMAALEAAHTDIKLQGAGGFPITDSLFLTGWMMCDNEYQFLTYARRYVDGIQFPAHSRRQPAFMGACTENGKPVNGVVLAVLDNPLPRAIGEPPYAPSDTTSLAATSAWRVDVDARRFVALQTNGLRCPRGGIVTRDGGM